MVPLSAGSNYGRTTEIDTAHKITEVLLWQNDFC